MKNVDDNPVIIAKRKTGVPLSHTPLIILVEPINLTAVEMKYVLGESNLLLASLCRGELKT
ncbi:MAG TPA: hypothetical protein VLL52_03525 [Anaerolineae bacterium]|nr:hypothetical protein [Anaerolineae bacterium]